MSEQTKFPCRCSKCGARKTLSTNPAECVLTDFVPQCKCGSTAWRVDQYRIKKEWGEENTCRCAGLQYPHKPGSTGCISVVRANHDRHVPVVVTHDADHVLIAPPSDNRRQRTFPPKPSIDRNSTLCDCRTNYKAH